MLKILDLFLLALIAEGADTPYRWQRRAAVSTGASLPSVRRLAALGLVNEADPGPRGSRRFSLTRAGRRELDNLHPYLEAALRTKNLDVESLLRLISIAYIRGERKIASALLEQAALERAAHGTIANEPLGKPLPASLAAFYSEALAGYEREKQIAALRSIGSQRERLKLRVSGESPDRSRRRARR